MVWRDGAIGIIQYGTNEVDEMKTEAQKHERIVVCKFQPLVCFHKAVLHIRLIYAPRRLYTHLC